MNLFLITIIFLVILFSCRKSLFKKKKNTKRKSKSKFRFNDWMELTKEERKELDLLDKQETMKKKQALLQSIREEYSKIKNK